MMVDLQIVNYCCPSSKINHFVTEARPALALFGYALALSGYFKPLEPLAAKPHHPLLCLTKTHRLSTTNAKSMPEMNLNREVLCWLIATRTGHGHFADYHDRFGHEEVDVHCRCGQKRLDFTLFLARMQDHIEPNCLA